MINFMFIYTKASHRVTTIVKSSEFYGATTISLTKKYIMLFLK